MHDISPLALQEIAKGEFEFLGSLGVSRSGTEAFLARDLRDGELVVVQPAYDAGEAGPSARPRLQVSPSLDASVPAGRSDCPGCRSPISGWAPFCNRCGADLRGVTPEQGGMSREQCLRAILATVSGHFSVLGSMTRAEGGGDVYFARELRTDRLVALTLQGAAPGLAADVRVSWFPPRVIPGPGGGGDGLRPGEAAGTPSPIYPTPQPGQLPRQPVTPWSRTPSPTPSAEGSSGTGQRVCPNCGDAYERGVLFCPRDGTPLRASGRGDVAGTVIGGSYLLGEKLGEGGMGQVYLAEHLKMGRKCALKLMHPSLTTDLQAVARFGREAASASRINHPNVAAVYDFGETPDGLVYLAMEYVEGETLKARLRRLGKIPEAEAVSITVQVLDALSVAHELGIIHRDLKPDNILLAHSRTGGLQVKVVDFGVAKLAATEQTGLTRTGYVVGTPEYMSPEQFIGDPIDHRSDLYAIGCILFEMVVGQRAFAGRSLESSITRRLLEAPPRVADLNPEASAALSDAVARSLERSPDLRFQTAREFQEALIALAGAGGAVRDVGATPQLGVRREPVVGAPALPDAPGSAPTPATRASVTVEPVPGPGSPGSRGPGPGGAPVPTAESPHASETGRTAPDARRRVVGFGAVAALLLVAALWSALASGDGGTSEPAAVAQTNPEPGAPGTEASPADPVPPEPEPRPDAGGVAAAVAGEERRRDVPASASPPRNPPQAAPTAAVRSTEPAARASTPPGVPVTESATSGGVPPETERVVPAQVAQPDAAELRSIRGDLAVGRVLFSRGDYADAMRTLDSARSRVAVLAERFPASREVQQLRTEISDQLGTVQSACRAEAELARRRGDPPPRCEI